MSLDGDLEDVSIATLLQMLLLERRRVAVLLKGPRGQGSFFLEHGSVVHATLGNREGRPAAMELLSWKTGHFKVLRSTPVPNRTLGGDPVHLFLDAFRWEDEEREKLALLPDGSLPRNVVEGLGQQLLGFMGRLERGLSQLRSPRVRRRPTGDLALLADLVEKTQSFLEDSPFAEGPPTLKELMQEVILAHPVLRLTFVSKKRLALGVVEVLYDGWEEGEEDRDLIFLQIRQGLVALLELQLKQLFDTFPENGPQEEWQETCSVFFGELRECVAVPT